MTIKVIVLLMLITASSTKTKEDESKLGISEREASAEKLCRFGGSFFPVDIFGAFVGWKCYENAFVNMKRKTVYVCTDEAAGVSYKIPCLKVMFSLI